MKSEYTARFSAFSEQSLYRSLNDELKDYVREMGYKYRLTFQELHQITEITADLAMWGEDLIRPENGLPKEKILRKIRDHWQTLREKETQYSSAPTTSEYSQNLEKKSLGVNEGNNGVLGVCPVASEKTVCCNLRTLDAVQGCGFGCSYCSIQTFYDPATIAVDENLGEKLRQITLDPKRKYHICSGQSSDSLLLGNRKGILDGQLEFARQNPNVILELKTKSNNVSPLLNVDFPRNVFVSWSMNPQIIIDNEEHRTASEDDRLDAARKLADRRIRVAFHFHPMIHYRAWRDDYVRLIEKVVSRFSHDEVAMVSFGTLTFIKPAMRSLRRKGIPSKVLQIPMEETAGKYSYPLGIKEEMFRTAWDAFQPWQGKVFFYLCMEGRRLWESVFGFCYDSNDAFEDAMLKDLSRKLGLDSQSAVS